MKVTYSWWTYLCLIFGTGILCYTKQEKLRDTSSCSEASEDSFSCSNGQCIIWSSVCDGRENCADGSDENKELCDREEFEKIYYKRECGRVYMTDHAVSTINSKKAIVGTAPWNVGIYQLNKHTALYTLICGGSIIAPNLIVSGKNYTMYVRKNGHLSNYILVAHCFWHRELLSKEISINGDSYKVAVGKYDKNFTVLDNEFTQIINVEMIYLNENYSGARGYYAHDIAIIVLSNRVSFSNFVAPVCIDWNGKYNVLNGDKGKVVGWGKMEDGTRIPVLLESSLPYVDHRTCRNMYTKSFKLLVTFDKFCAGSILGKEPTAAIRGAGLTFVHSNSSYLTGVANMKDPTSNNSITVFIDIRHHVDWIRKLYIKYYNHDNNIQFCILQTVEGVVYSYYGSNETITYGTLVNQYRTVIENCDVGYHKTYPNSFRVCQENGKWISTSDKLCLKMCPPLLSDSLDIKCTLNGKFANCSNLSIPNTIAIPSCKPTYIAPIGLEEIPFELHCQSNGKWNYQLYKCNPYCGRVYTNSQILIANGKKAFVGTAPWNVGIYRLNKENRNYDLICGGSIISPNLIISAAHCLWHRDLLSKKISIDDDSYKVAVGKYDRNFTIVDNDFTQIINVEIIYINEDYYGPNGFHAHDIAVLMLSNRVSFSNVVSPVCIDWNNKYNISNGVEGKIVGWGITEKGLLSPVLLETYLPYIDHNSCRDMYTNGFQIFVTVDKFCAGSESVLGQDMGEGDSGSGLTFLHSNSYYLTGVLSLKESSSNNSIAVFTDIKYHVQWIRRLYNKHN